MVSKFLHENALIFGFYELAQELVQQTHTGNCRGLPAAEWRLTNRGQETQEQKEDARGPHCLEACSSREKGVEMNRSSTLPQQCKNSKSRIRTGQQAPGRTANKANRSWASRTAEDSQVIVPRLLSAAWHPRLPDILPCLGRTPRLSVPSTVLPQGRPILLFSLYKWSR